MLKRKMKANLYEGKGLTALSAVVIILFIPAGIVDIKRNRDMNMKKNNNPFCGFKLINLPEKLDLSSFKNGEKMFYGCNLKEINLEQKLKFARLKFEPKNVLNIPDSCFSNLKEYKFTDIVKQKKAGN